MSDRSARIRPACRVRSGTETARFIPLASVFVCALLVACGRHRPPQQPAAQGAELDLRARGEQFARMGDDVRAEHYLSAALETGASVDEVLPQLLRACVRSQRYATALQYAEDYMPEARKVEPLMLVTSSLYLATGDVARAQALLERLLKQGPNARAHLLLADLYAEQLEDYARADEHYEAYVSLAPHEPRAQQLREQLERSMAVGEGAPHKDPFRGATR